MKYSFLLPYYNRREQFIASMDSWKRWYGHRKDWEIIVVQDDKGDPAPQALPGIRNFYTWQKVPVSNPCTSYNKAASAAMGQFFIVTNPEVRHDVDILGALDAIFATNPRQYVVCSCEAKRRDGKHFMWYQHSQHRNACYHFCTAISRDCWFEAGGFDEEYAKGIAYDDNDFREAVRALGIPFVVRDDLKTTHLWHEKPHLEIPNKAELEARNKAYYEKKWAGII